MPVRLRLPTPAAAPPIQATAAAESGDSNAGAPADSGGAPSGSADASGGGADGGASDGGAPGDGGGDGGSGATSMALSDVTDGLSGTVADVVQAVGPVGSSAPLQDIVNTGGLIDGLNVNNR